MRRESVVAAVLIAGFPPLLRAGPAPDSEPWSVSAGAPALVSTNRAPGGVAGQAGLARSLPVDFGHGWLRFYQEYLSPLGTARCPMTPSCSRYSMQAIAKHGLLMGIVMTADRLIHEIDEKETARVAGSGSDAKYSDPVEHNDFWWCKP